MSSSDFELKTTLTADGSQLADAMRKAEKDTQNYAQSVSQGANISVASMQASTTAINAQSVAARSSATAASNVGRAAAESAANVQKLGISAGQTAQAMRQLPAQFTDIITSLQAGQSPLTVLLQQGGQIKDSFGGIGPAFRAVTGAIPPMVLGLTAGAAAAGALALAYAQGSSEADGYTKAIVMSGNAAGTTVSMLTAMAERMDAVSGTQASAAEALTQLTATGQVANRNLEAFASTAQGLESWVGQSVAETVKHFEALGRKPLEASVKLNETLGYLTSATYEQIKALKEQGRTEEAGSVAQEAYAKAMDDRKRQVEANAGAMERAWRGVKKVAAEAWDAMLGIGRKDTTQQQLDSVGLQLKALDNGKSQNPALTQRRREAIVQRQAELQEQLRLEGRSASTQAEERAAVDEHVRAAEEADKKKKAAASALASAAKQEAEARARAEVDSVKNGLNGLAGAYGDAERIMESQRAAGLLSEAEYWDSKRAFIKLNEAAQLNALAQENALLASQKATGAERVTLDAQIAQNKAEMARVQAKATTDAVISNAQEAASLTQLQRAQKEYARQLQETTGTRARQHRREMDSLGRGDSARGLAGRQNSVDDRNLQQRVQLDGDRLANRLTESEYQARLAALKAFHSQALAAEVDYQAELQTAQLDGSLGMTRALENYLDSARNIAGQTEQLFSNAFKGMEDGIVQFAMTGKMNFKSFAESVISDLIRIYVRQQMAGMLNSMAASMGGGDLSVSHTDTGGMTSGGQWVPTAGGRAGGGSVDAGRMYEVNELGPEVVSVDGHDYLMMGSRGGHVTPNDRSLMPLSARPAAASASGNGAVNITMPLNVINNTGTPVQASAQQRSDGGFDLIIEAIETSIAGNVSGGSGPLARAVEGRYGLRPTFA